MRDHDAKIIARRQLVFLVLSGLFLGSIAILNILGVSRFLDLSFSVFGFVVPMPLAIGVLPYPITFLCTDFISEIFGRKRANQVVWMGLVLNIWTAFILWVAGALPGSDSPAFFEIRRYAFSAIWASMIAYLIAQLVDVELFHFWKRLTKGKHLWLRNNGSTLVSQLVDTVSVIMITYWLTPSALPLNAGDSVMPQLAVLIGAGYTFKLAVALADTLPFYAGTRFLRRFLALDEAQGMIT